MDLRFEPNPGKWHLLALLFLSCYYPPLSYLSPPELPSTFVSLPLSRSAQLMVRLSLSLPLELSSHSFGILVVLSSSFSEAFS